jgi:CheY-like chemotaxis protein
MTPTSIMIVDDDIEDIEIFIDGVHEVDESITCISAQNGLEAIEKLNATEIKPDYIFVDLNMPKLNGSGLIKELKKRSDLSQIKIIVYSTNNVYNDKDEFIKLGAEDYISKPTTLTDLCDAIKNVIEHA